MTGAGTRVGVVGAGIMGGGIAQVAAQAGHEVTIVDAVAGQAAQAVAAIRQRLERAVSRGRLAQDEATTCGARLAAADEVAAVGTAGLVIEAIAESAAAKRGLFTALGRHCAGDAVLATNTSAIPLEQLRDAAGNPGRFAGLHFFNPAPVMRLVEVVEHDAIAPDLTGRLVDLMQRWGKAPIVTRSAPGFVANRLARPYFIEALRLHEEDGIPCAVVDDSLTACAGFRMGPFALMDLIGNDVNCTNNASIHAGLGGDARFAPGRLQGELVAAGKLGRKSGTGFYAYGDAATALVASQDGGARDGQLPLVAGLAPTDGRPAAARAGEVVAVHDWVRPDRVPATLAVAFTPGASAADRSRMQDALASAGTKMVEVPDRPGLVVARTVAALVAVAADAAAARLAATAAMDQAMVTGMNHPMGPTGWLALLGTGLVERTLAHLDRDAPPGRYRPCDLAALA